MILHRTKPTNPLCGRLKQQKIEIAVVDVTLSGCAVSLCAECARIVEEDGGEIRGCNEQGYPLDPTHPGYRS
jgi:hypothetical protein